MNIRGVINSCLLTALVIVVSCGRRQKVLIEVDFSARGSWLYDFNGYVGGRAVLSDRVHTFSSNVYCLLSGKGKVEDPSFMKVAVDSVDVSSEHLNDSDMENIEKRLLGTTISFSLKDGILGGADSIRVPSVSVGGWDLYRHFVKLLPILPKGRVCPGHTWDRTSDFPLEMSQGSAIGHVYQTFSFDSLFFRKDRNRCANISWSFSYSVEAKDIDTAGMLDDLPKKGTGTGNAVIDINGKSLISAEIEFTIPQDSSEVFQVSWEERASLALREGQEQ